jgi:hypothetical protein
MSHDNHIRFRNDVRRVYLYRVEDVPQDTSARPAMGPLGHTNPASPQYYASDAEQENLTTATQTFAIVPERQSVRNDEAPRWAKR